MKIDLFDCVELIGGQTGTVVEIFDRGRAFMVEITDSEGQTIETPTISAEDIVRVTYKAQKGE